MNPDNKDALFARIMADLQSEDHDAPIADAPIADAPIADALEQLDALEAQHARRILHVLFDPLPAAGSADEDDPVPESASFDAREAAQAAAPLDDEIDIEALREGPAKKPAQRPLAKQAGLRLSRTYLAAAAVALLSFAGGYALNNRIAGEEAAQQQRQHQTELQRVQQEADKQQRALQEQLGKLQKTPPEQRYSKEKARADEEAKRADKEAKRAHVLQLNLNLTQANLDRLSDEHDDTLIELAGLKAALDFNQKALDTMRSRRDGLQKSLDMANGRLRQSEADKGALRGQLALADKHAAAADAKAKEAEATVADLKGQLARLQAQLASANKRIQELEAALKQAQARAAAAEVKAAAAEARARAAAAPPPARP